MKKISVIGCGTMGHSIGLAVAWAGFPVTLIGMNDADLATADIGLQNKLQVMLENELINKNEVENIHANIELSKSLEEVVAVSDFIFEVIPEQIDMKWVLYEKLEGLVSETCIIASNTSGFKPSELAKNMELPTVLSSLIFGILLI